MKRSLNIFKLAVALIAASSLISARQPVFAQERLAAREIIKRQDDLMRGNSLHGRYVMTVTTPGWTRRLELDAWEKGRDRTFIRILSPAKEAGIGTLRIKESMWNYLPNVERTIKIPPSVMLQPWMGSDFANDDLVKESSVVNDYNHTILGEEKMGGSPVYRIQLLPKPEAAVTWGKIIFWVRKEDFIPVREEYFKENGELIKTLEYSMVKKMSDRQIPTYWKMTPKNKEGHSTVVEVFNVIYNQPVADSIFTLENLKSRK